MVLTRRQRMKAHVKSCTYSSCPENDTRVTGTSHGTPSPIYHLATLSSGTPIIGEDGSTSGISEDHCASATPVLHKESANIQLEASFPVPLSSEVTTQDNVGHEAQLSATPMPSFSQKGKNTKVKGRRFMSGAHYRKVNVKVACLHCDEIVSRKNLKRHMRRYHESANTCKLRAVVVDCQNGLFLVSQGKQGSDKPVHVKFCVSSSAQKIQCEDEECDKTMKAFARGKISTYSCQHINAVMQAEPFTNLPVPTPMDVDSLVQENMIRMESADHLKRILQKCEDSGIPPAVFWERPDSTHTQYAYISVFCPKATYYAPLGRTIIRYNKIKGTYDCKCNDQKIGCIHKRMGLLHIFKNYRSILKDLNPQQELESENDEHLQVQVQRDQALLDRYIQYLREKNKHFHIPEALNMLPCVDPGIKALYPSERTCHICPGNPRLQELVVVSQSARIYDVDAVIQGNVR